MGPSSTIEAGVDRRRSTRPTGPIAIGPDDDWVAPAFWDIQTNGRWGYSFSSPELTVEQVVEIVRRRRRSGRRGSARP